MKLLNYVDVWPCYESWKCFGYSLKVTTWTRNGVHDVVILTLEGGQFSWHDLVEDVVGALQSLLGDDTSFLQQVFILKKRKIFEYFIAFDLKCC
jgi:hypothetical protein